MILISKDNTNKIYVLVSDVLDDTSYTLRLRNGTTNKVTEVPITKENVDTIRYDEFSFDESEYNLNTGLYDYQILNNEGDVGSEGKALVTGDLGSLSKYFTDPQEIKQYKG